MAGFDFPDEESSILVHTILPDIIASNGCFMSIPINQATDIGLTEDRWENLQEVSFSWKNGWGKVFCGLSCVKEVDGFFVYFYPGIVNFIRENLSDHQK